MSSIQSTLVSALALVLVACSGSASDGDDDADSSQTAIIARPRPAATTTAAFDPASGGLPEGLAVRGNTAYVGMAPTGEILAVDITTGESRAFATLPHPVPNQGFMTGLVTGEGGSLYAALVSFSPDVQAGIYRVGPEGGAAKLFAKHASMAFPNGLVFGKGGELYATDSARGSVFRIERNGTAAEWIHADVLAGSKDFCGVDVGAAFDIGANGIARRGDELVIANSDKALLVRVPILKDGSAGKTSLLAPTDCERLGGADGIAEGSRGELLVATNRSDRIVRVTKDGAIDTVVQGAPLDFPASIVPISNSEALVTSFALGRASSGGDARPALIRVRTSH